MLIGRLEFWYHRPMRIAALAKLIRMLEALLTSSIAATAILPLARQGTGGVAKLFQGCTFEHREKAQKKRSVIR